MVVKIKEQEGRDFPMLIASDMTKKEYVIMEKLYDEPKEGHNEKGNFDWTLYSVAVSEYASFDEDAEETKVTTLDEPQQMSFFKNSKTFRDKFDPLPINTKVKVTQEKVDGKSYKVFNLEELGTGSATPATSDDNKEVTPMQLIANLKKSGVDLGSAVGVVISKFPDQTEATVKAVYENV